MHVDGTRARTLAHRRRAWHLFWQSAVRGGCNRSTRRRERIYRGHRVYAARHDQDNRRLIGSLRVKRVCSIKKKLCRTGFFARRRCLARNPANPRRKLRGKRSRVSRAQIFSNLHRKSPSRWVLPARSIPFVLCPIPKIGARKNLPRRQKSLPTST